MILQFSKAVDEIFSVILVSNVWKCKGNLQQIEKSFQRILHRSRSLWRAVCSSRRGCLRFTCLSNDLMENIRFKFIRTAGGPKLNQAVRLVSNRCRNFKCLNSHDCERNLHGVGFII